MTAFVIEQAGEIREAFSYERPLMETTRHETVLKSFCFAGQPDWRLVERLCGLRPCFEELCGELVEVSSEKEVFMEA